jgi:hypothetical protein
MREQRSTLRAGALIATSALALHELRYLIGAPPATAGDGHGYLPVAGAVASLLLALAGAQLVHALIGATRASAHERGPVPLRTAWPLASAALLAVYCGQELTEGMLASGHPGGLAALTAHSGLVAAPLAVGLGLFVALALRGAGAAIAAAARRRRAQAPRVAIRPAPARPAAAPAIALDSPLARHLAGRAPPASS